MKRELCAGAMRLLAAAFFFSLAPAGAEHLATPDAPPPGEAPAPSEPTRDHAPSRATPEAERLSRRPSFGPETEPATASAARRYADIAASGGWPRIARPLDRSAQGKPVVELRRRLAAEGYLSSGDAHEEVWDERLAAAVRRFQKNVGLDDTGDVSRETVRELNVSPDARARQLAATAARLAKTKFDFAARYVAVNIPAASVEAIESGEAQKQFTAIVGGRRDPSPQIVAKIVAIDINPAWTVPDSIIKKELAPKLRRNPQYLARQNIRMLDGKGREVDPSKLRRASKARAAQFTFRQEPGPKNALGSIRISMPNKEAVFLHDTPNKELFDKDYRFLSHGCVRVEGVYELAAWLLRDSGDWDPAALRDEVERGESRKIELQEPVPVVWVYMTGWATSDGGPAHFRRDIYNLDKGAKPPPPEGVARG